MTRRGGRPGSRLSPKAVEYWREYEGTLKELKQAANSDPAQSLFGKGHAALASRLSMSRISATSMNASLVCTFRS